MLGDGEFDPAPGVIKTAADVLESLDAGASLVQWFTGYFEAFSQHGHKLYSRLYEPLSEEIAKRSEP